MERVERNPSDPSITIPAIVYASHPRHLQVKRADEFSEMQVESAVDLWRSEIMISYTASITQEPETRRK